MQPQPQEPNSVVCFQLALLLVRSAAASRRRNTLLSPVPEMLPNTIHNNNNIVNDEEEPCLPMARRIFALPPNLTSTRSSSSLDQESLVWRNFLLALPWVDQGQRIKTKTSSTSTCQQRGTTTLHLTIQLHHMGDATPHFTKRAQQWGSCRVYHGTPIDRLWSILHYGLHNLSTNTFLMKHGHVLGDGIYASTSYQVARQFAAGSMSSASQQEQQQQQVAWRHEALGQLVEKVLEGDPHNNNNNNNNKDVAATTKKSRSQPFFRPGWWQNAHISCFPVLQAEILAPPSDHHHHHHHHNTNDRTTVDHHHTLPMPTTRRSGNYFVVPSPRDLRLTHLHLTMEIRMQQQQPATKQPTTVSNHKNKTDPKQPPGLVPWWLSFLKSWAPLLLPFVLGVGAAYVLLRDDWWMEWYFRQYKNSK